jgi:hypothetical protein
MKPPEARPSTTTAGHGLKGPCSSIGSLPLLEGPCSCIGSLPLPLATSALDGARESYNKRPDADDGPSDEEGLKNIHSGR